MLGRKKNSLRQVTHFSNAAYFSGEPDAAEMKCDLRERPQGAMHGAPLFWQAGFTEMWTRNIFFTPPIYRTLPLAKIYLRKPSFSPEGCGDEWRLLILFWRIRIKLGSYSCGFQHHPCIRFHSYACTWLPTHRHAPELLTPLVNLV